MRFGLRRVLAFSVEDGRGWVLVSVDVIVSEILLNMHSA